MLSSIHKIRSFFSQSKQKRARNYENEIIRTVVEQLGQVIWVDSLDKSQSILNLGDYENLYDRDPTNLEKDPLDWIKAIHPEDIPKVKGLLYLQKSGDFDVTYRVVHKNGAIKWLQDRSFVLNDSSGKPAYLAGLARDITAQVELEEQVRHAHKMKAVGELAGGICHDFNNLLAVIQGNIELAQAEKISKTAASRLDTAFNACERGSSLTHRLLAYSRKQPLSPTSINPASLLNELEGILKRSVSEAIDLEVVSAAGLWECFADKNELETVLLNLAVNAQQAMNNNGKLTVEVYNARIDEEYAQSHQEVNPGQYICFAVTDNGSGMSKELIDKAFDPFFTTKEAGEGSGLGLSMAYGFAKQSAGHIKIYSEVNKGTTVKLYLPRSIDPVNSKTSSQPQLSIEKLKGVSILIVENDDNVRQTVEAQIQSANCIIHSVKTATDAIAIANSGTPIDLLLFDVVLDGDLTGPQLAEIISKERPNVSRAFMTGYTENAIIHDGRLDPGVILLQKPFTKNQLLSACLRALGAEQFKP